MHFYIKTKNGKPVTTGANNDCLIYMRQYGGHKTDFDNGTFIVSTGERIQPHLWDAGKNYPKQSQTSIIASIEKMRSEALDFLAHNNRNGIVTKTGYLRNQLNPPPEVPQVMAGTLLSLWDEKLSLKPKTARTSSKPDAEVSGRNSFARWLTYERELWTADQVDSKLSPVERDRHKIPADPRYFTQQMFDGYLKFLKEGEKSKKAFNSRMAYSRYFKALCRWIEKTKRVRVDFDYEEIDTTMKSARKGKPILNPEKVEKISRLPVSRSQEYLRDMMLLQIYVGCRYSDLFRVAENTDRETGVWSMELTKRVDNGSGKRVVQQLIKPASDILKKYNYSTPVIDLDPFNEGIREIVREVDPHTTIEVRNEVTGEFEKKYLWQVYSSHDNIRTCVSIAEQTGMPTSSIAKNVGKTRDTLEKHYLSTEANVAKADWSRLEGGLQGGGSQKGDGVVDDMERDPVAIMADCLRQAIVAKDFEQAAKIRDLMKG